MVAKNAVIQLLTEFAKDIKGIGIHLRKVILYGSYASGNPHKWSDIDVALVADEFHSRGYEDRKLFSSIKFRKDYVDIHTRTFSPEDFTSDNPFVAEILETGIEIHV
jgi:predicted nucleotidyltransferase